MKQRLVVTFDLRDLAESIAMDCSYEDICKFVLAIDVAAEDSVLTDMLYKQFKEYYDKLDEEEWDHYG